jgi:hypothetical protein
LGIIFTDARNLLELRGGQKGGKAVFLGRLTVRFHDSDLNILRRIVPKDPETESWFRSYSWNDFAENFFRDILKFETVDSIDFSAYEGATIVHDLGEPLPPKFIGKFDLAVDGGTLEHVFNFPVAIGNLMKLVRVGGTIYLRGPCNNLCGHGFYQFSPELMHRVFATANGFEPIFVRVSKARYPSVELTAGHAEYDVTDPEIARQRVNLVTSVPMLILVMARRVADIEPFRAKVLQSDYVSKWGGRQSASRLGLTRRLKTVVRRLLPTRIMNHILGLNERRKASLAHRGHYRRVW